MSNNFKILANAPDNVPIGIDLDTGVVHIDKPSTTDEGLMIDINKPNCIIGSKALSNVENQDWVNQFFERMDAYIKASSPCVGVSKSGELIIEAHATPTALKDACNHLGWLYESQSRQNKEILIWIGEIILDYIAKSPHDLSVEEAIEELGYLDRDNGVKWKLKTLAKWPIVVLKIPHEIRQLPIPQSYLSEAAVFAQPEEPVAKIKFANCRDALLLSVAESPEEWSRNKFVACMKELQQTFGVESTRNEGVASLQGRLICLYRLQREVEQGHTTFAKLGLSDHEIAAWVYNIESELQYRKVIDPDPTANIPVGDGLTKAARERIIKKSEKANQHLKENESTS